MGCVHSAPEPQSKAKPTVEPSPEPPVTRKSARVKDEEHLAAKALAVPLPSVPPPPTRPETAVMKQAGAFDKFHEDALKAPEVKQQQFAVGAKSKRLLDGFEKKEAEARAPPVLVNVDKTDVRRSKLFDKLQGYEALDAQAAADPKLDKTFVEKERERLSSAAPRVTTN